MDTGIQTSAEPMSPIFMTIRNGTAESTPMMPIRMNGAPNQR